MIVALVAALTIAAASPSPTPSATPGGVYAAQAIDLERGYIVFAGGDALKIAAGAPVIDAGSGATAAFDPGMYAQVTLDATGLVTMGRLAQAPITGAPETDVPRRFVVQASARFPNPDLIPPPRMYPASKLTRLEQITITVTEPPQTPFTDEVYIGTDTSGWNARAIRMQRIDGRRFRVTMEVAPGSQFHYLFTRGSWQTVETDAAGLRRAPRTLVAQGAASLVVDASVQRWIDLP